MVINNQKKFCAAPWRGLHINPNGDIKTCCAGDPNMLGNLHNLSIDEVLSGDLLNEIRDTIKQGKLHTQYCYNCIQAERYGVSERDWHNSVNTNFDITTADNCHVPVLVDIRWNITCNLSCNYCGDKCSSKWAALNKISFKSGVRSYYQSVVDYLELHQQHIREVALVGGEPLLLPENEKLLSILSDNTTITLITNISVDLNNNAIFKQLSNKHNVGWSLSFDNIGSRFEYVRYGADWQVLQTNIEKIKLLFKQGHWGGIHAVYSLYNATHLTEFFNWARENQLTIHWQSLYQPECLDPLKHSKEIRALCITELEIVLARTDLEDSERSFLTQALQNFNNNTNCDNLNKELIHHINDIEEKFHKDKKGQFSKLWPDLSKYLYG